MTVLVAVIDRTAACAWLGSDTLATSGQNTFLVASKIVRIGAALVGTCGTPSAGRFLRAYTLLPTDADHEATVRWVDDLVGAWRSWARDEHYADKDTGDTPWWAIVATPLGLWSLGSDGSVVEHADDYAAEGSGAGPALGALWGMAVSGGVVGRERVELAVVAAIAHGDGCGGTVRVEMTEYTERRTG